MRKAVREKTRISRYNRALTAVNRGQGFSLVELLIALTLLLAALALAPAYLSKGVSTAELKSNVRQIASGLQAARAESIARNSERVFLLDVDEKLFLIGEGGAANRLSQSLEFRIKTAQSEQSGENRAGIRFFPDGSSTGGEILVATDNKSLKIAVNWVTGKVAVFDDD